MLLIRNDQLETLQEPELRRFETAMIAHIRRCFPTDHDMLGETGVLAVIRTGQREAEALGFTMQGDVRLFIDHRLVLGSGLMHDPLLPWAGECISQGPGHPGTMARLAQDTGEYLALTSGPTGQYALRALLRATKIGFDELADGAEDEDGTLNLLRRLWPEKFVLLPVERRPVFLAAAADAAQSAGLDTPSGRRLFAVLMFLMGVDFASDPAHPWAAASLAATHGRPAEARAEALHGSAQAAAARALPLLPPVS